MPISGRLRCADRYTSSFWCPSGTSRFPPPVLAPQPPAGPWRGRASLGSCPDAGVLGAVGAGALAALRRLTQGLQVGVVDVLLLAALLCKRLKASVGNLGKSTLTAP